MMCNFCVFTELKRLHDDHQDERNLEASRFHIVPDPKESFPDGVQVMCLREEIIWFAKLPTECHCNDIRAHSIRNGPSRKDPVSGHDY
jgi:hypothetical protein